MSEWEQVAVLFSVVEAAAKHGTRYANLMNEALAALDQIQAGPSKEEEE